jgi:hypothetical protein
VIPLISIGDLTLFEGNGGTTAFAFPVTLSAAPTGAVTVNFTTFDGLAMAPGDYQAASGTLSIAPGQTSGAIVVAVVGELLPETNETFLVLLSGATGGQLIDSPALGTIVNDDLVASAEGELVHGSTLVADLRAQGIDPDEDLYRISQKPHASYEVVVDATSGDLGTPQSPIRLGLLAGDLTVLRNGVPLGAGTSLSLRFENTLGATQDNELIRVVSGLCQTTCDASDTYRLRVWETTLGFARLNNSGTQVTVLILEKSVWYWNAAGVLAGSQVVALLPHETGVINTSATVPGTSGSITVSYEGSYGQLVGKAVAIEPATGFTFDTEMRPRPR